MFRESWYYPEGTNLRDPHIAGYATACECRACRCDVEEGEEIFKIDGEVYCEDCAEVVENEIAMECVDCGRKTYEYTIVSGFALCEDCLKSYKEEAKREEF